MYGFIECPDTYAKFGRDIYFDVDTLGDRGAYNSMPNGALVRFALTEGAEALTGPPRANSAMVLPWEKQERLAAYSRLGIDVTNVEDSDPEL